MNPMWSVLFWRLEQGRQTCENMLSEKKKIKIKVSEAREEESEKTIPEGDGDTWRVEGVSWEKARSCALGGDAACYGLSVS